MRQCVFIPKDLFQRLEQACRDRYQKRSRIIQLALMSYLDGQKPNNGSHAASSLLPPGEQCSSPRVRGRVCRKSLHRGLARPCICSGSAVEHTWTFGWRN
jgi:hypothetical protein